MTSTNALQDEIDQQKKRLKILEEQKKQEQNQEIDAVLERWRNKIESIPNDSPKEYKLSFLGWTGAHSSIMQCMHYINLGQYGEKKWSFDTYTRSDAEGVPLEFYGPTIDSLRPDDIKTLSLYGVRWKIEKLNIQDISKSAVCLKKIADEFTKNLCDLRLDKSLTCCDYTEIRHVYHQMLKVAKEDRNRIYDQKIARDIHDMDMLKRIENLRALVKGLSIQLDDLYEKCK